jgi:hypothetical protein
MDIDSRDTASRLAPAWLTHPKGDFVLVVVRLCPPAVNAPRISARRVVDRVVDLRVADLPGFRAVLEEKVPELAAAIVAASTCGAKMPHLVFSFDYRARKPALN